MEPSNDYRQIIKKELENRCRRNSNYSLRAFARDLGISSSRLSEVLNAKTGLSLENARRIANFLSFNEAEVEYFCDLVEAEHARSKVKREMARLRLARLQNAPVQSLELDHFCVISDWYHFAIFEFIKLQNKKSDPRQIAHALGISEVEAKQALERLDRLGIIQKKRKSYVQVSKDIAVASAAPSEAIRRFHREILQKALLAIDLQNIERRELGATTMAIHSSDLPLLKEKIRTFRRELNAMAAQSKKKDRVYCIATQFFELTDFGEQR